MKGRNAGLDHGNRFGSIGERCKKGRTDLSGILAEIRPKAMVAVVLHGNRADAFDRGSRVICLSLHAKQGAVDLLLLLEPGGLMHPSLA